MDTVFRQGTSGESQMETIIAAIKTVLASGTLGMLFIICAAVFWVIAISRFIQIIVPNRINANYFMATIYKLIQGGNFSRVQKLCSIVPRSVISQIVQEAIPKFTDGGSMTDRRFVNRMEEITRSLMSGFPMTFVFLCLSLALGLLGLGQTTDDRSYALGFGILFGVPAFIVFLSWRKARSLLHSVEIAINEMKKLHEKRSKESARSVNMA